jgi:hypothetical protein
VQRKRLELERYASMDPFPGSPLMTVGVWPLQLHVQTNQAGHRLQLSV